MTTKPYFKSLILLAAVAAYLPAQVIAASTQSPASAGESAGANRVISVDMQRRPLDRALKEIAALAGMRVIFSNEVTASRVLVTLRHDKISAISAMERALRNTGLVATVTPEGTAFIVRPRPQGQKAAQGVVAGRVTDAKNGKGVSGVTVSAGNAANSVVTGGDGSYRLSNVPGGDQIISARLVGYARQTRSITVAEGAIVTVDFELEPSANVLDQVVVTGTVVATELKAVPNAISVITARDIQTRGITRIDQLFRGDIPGLFSLNMGSRASVDEVTMFSRGATALSATSAGVDPLISVTNAIKTYIDGVEMTDARFLSQIDPGSIERIEILTGPQASTVYGSNAINGVMQIFTKRGSGSRPQLALNLSTGVAQNNSSPGLASNHVTGADITGREGRFGYNVGGSWVYEGSWTPGKKSRRLSAYGGGRVEMGKLSADFSGRQGSTNNTQNGNTSQPETDLRISGVWNPNSTQGLPTPRVATLNGRTLGFSMSYRPLSWWTHNLVLGADSYATEAMRTRFGYSNPFDTTLLLDTKKSARTSQSYNSTAQLPLGRFAGLNLTIGGDHWRTTGSGWTSFSSIATTGTIASPTVTRDKPGKNSGAFVQGQLSFANSLFLTYGVRADWNPNFGEDARVKPGRYGLSYARDFDTPVGPLSTKLRGSYGRSIRPPGVGQALAQSAVAAGLNTNTINQFGNFDFFKANPDLGPEHQSGGEGGVELYFGSRGSVVVTRFNQTVDNLISNVFGVDSVASLFPVYPSTTNCSTLGSVHSFDSEGRCFTYQRQYLNVGSIRNQGWETQGSVNVGPFTTRGTYSWVKSRVLGVTPRYRPLILNTNFQPGRPVDFVPEHTWAVNMTYSQSRSTVALSINGVGMRYIGSDALNQVTSSNSRSLLTRPRMSLSDYRPLGSGYATADMNVAHRFSRRLDAILQINNLTDYYQNDFNASVAAIGRTSRVGLRLRVD